MSRGSLALAALCLLGLGLTAWLLARSPHSGPSLARLTEVRGDTAERDFAAEVGTWSSAQPGAEFRLGDGLRTGAKTRAKLHFVDASQLEVQPDTVLRFLASGNNDETDPELAIDVQSGEALLRTSSSDLHVRTHIGSFVVKSGTLVMLKREGDKLGFQVELGSLRFRDSTGDERNLESGDELQVAIGMAVMGEVAAPEQEVAALELSVAGPGARLRQGKDQPWQALAAGRQRVDEGSELSLAVGSSAILRRGQDRAELKGDGHYVLGGDGVLIRAQSGELSAESVSEDVAIQVPGGVIVLRKANGGSQASLRVSKDEGSLTVQRGSVSATLNGTTQELAAGEQQRWSVSEETAQILDDEPPSGGVEAPSYSNIGAPAGESFVLHAPELPVSVALDFGSKCPDQGEVQLSGSRLASRGAARVNVLLTKGTRSYSVRCIGAKGTGGRVVARGTIHVLLDPGTRKLPPLPPSSLADADGRTYTLYYSNQAPALKLRWPNPPKEGPYQLEVDGKKQNISGPEHVFKSGELPDGLHAVSFGAGTRRSRTTTIDVRFDNNAPTASVSQPGDRSFSPGQPLQITGVSLPAWKVSLSGGTIHEEADGRFTGTITPTAEHPDIAVRLSHPRRGVHYYLRRAASSP
jgi:hypothetical protein